MGGQEGGVGSGSSGRLLLLLLLMVVVGIRILKQLSIDYTSAKF